MTLQDFSVVKSYLEKIKEDNELEKLSDAFYFMALEEILDISDDEIYESITDNSFLNSQGQENGHDRGIDAIYIEEKGRPIVHFFICPTCENTFEKAPRCPECGQKIKYTAASTKNTKFKSLDEWATGANIIGAKGTDVINIVNKILGQHSSLSYHLGTKDLSIDYIGKNGDKLQVLMLFGKERCGAFQPSTYVSYFDKNGIPRTILDEYLEKMKVVLSSDQKNQPYERMNGYYFIDYKTIIEKPEELMSIIVGLCKSISE